jgi:hypothetical protein
MAIAAPMRPVIAIAALASLTLPVGACTLKPDPPAAYNPNPLGPGLRISQVQDPSSPQYAPNTTVNVTSVDVSFIDTYDETHDGKSIGTVYIQDVGSSAPYSGLSLYESSFVPADLRLLPGDVIDVDGPYDESSSVGSAVFPTGHTLPQFNKPVSTFRYAFTSPTPTVVSLDDLDMHADGSNYLPGRKWENMLVTVNDVVIAGGETDSTGLRISYLMGDPDGSIDLNACAISNELYPLGKNDFPAGTHFTSVTGIVTWFYTYQIAPRSAADLVQ